MTHQQYTSANFTNLQGSSSSLQIAIINCGTRQCQGYDRKYSQTCNYCGYVHCFSREYCLAMNDAYNVCGKLGNWATVCISVKYKTKEMAKGKSWFNGRNQSRHRQHDLGRNVDSVDKHDDQAMADIDAAMEKLTFSSTKTKSGKPPNMKGPRMEAFVDLNIKLADLIINKRSPWQSFFNPNTCSSYPDIQSNITCTTCHDNTPLAKLSIWKRT